MAVASRNWKASWTSGDWVSRREAKAWNSGGRLLVVFFMLPLVADDSLQGTLVRGQRHRIPAVSFFQQVTHRSATC